MKNTNHAIGKLDMELGSIDLERQLINVDALDMPTQRKYWHILDDAIYLHSAYAFKYT